MDRTREEVNFTVQGVGSPVPASVGGERAGPETSSSSDRNTNLIDFGTPGVAHLAPVERTATSAKESNPFQKTSRVNRTPPSTSRALQHSPKKPPAARNVFQADVEKEGAASNNSLAPMASKDSTETSVFYGEIQKCMEILISMKAACGKQKNISMGIKNGIAALEESLDKLKWEEKARVERKRAKPSTPAIPQSGIDKAIQTDVSAPEQTRNVNEKHPENKAGSSKRPPTSPLSTGSEKRTRKSPQKREVQIGQQRTLVGKKLEERSYAEALKKSTEAIDVLQNTQEDRAREKPKKTARENRKKPKKKNQLREKPEAILIKPKGNENFSGILREIRSKANPDDTETIVKNVRQTKSGDVLLELGPKTKDKKAFGESLKAILGEKATVRNLEPKTAIEIRDLDELTTVEEVEEAIRKKTADLITDIQVSITGKNRRSLKMAIVHINARAAQEMLRTPSIKVGWVQCRIRRRTEVPRCFKCFGYGHKQSSCTSVDRKGQGLCINCGETGHKKKECTNPPKCCLCVELETTPSLNHVPGTGNCQVFRKALEQAKKASSK